MLQVNGDHQPVYPSVCKHLIRSCIKILFPRQTGQCIQAGRTEIGNVHFPLFPVLPCLDVKHIAVDEPLRHTVFLAADHILLTPPPVSSAALSTKFKVHNAVSIAELFHKGIRIHHLQIEGTLLRMHDAVSDMGVKRAVSAFHGRNLVFLIHIENEPVCILFKVDGNQFIKRGQFKKIHNGKFRMFRGKLCYYSCHLFSFLYH